MARSRMTPSRCRSLLIVVAVTMTVVSGSPLPVRGELVLTNLSLEGDSSDLVKSDLWQAASFKVQGGDSWVLQSATVRMGNAIDSSGNFFLSVYAESDTGFGPTGSPLASLAGSTNPSTAGDYTYVAPGGGLSVDEGSTYWLVAGVTSGDGNYLWRTVGNATISGSWVWGVPYAKAWSPVGIDGPWNPETSYPLMLSLTASAVPEPSTYVMALAGLACGSFSMWRRRKPA